jgi:hypothetical protein
MFNRLSLVSLLVWTYVHVGAHVTNPMEDEQQNHPQLHFLAPHPMAGQMLTAEDAATMLGHYAKPPGGCMPDEQAFQISGVPGMVSLLLMRRHCGHRTLEESFLVVLSFTFLYYR